jgi:hypothetical protein
VEAVTRYRSAQGASKVISELHDEDHELCFSGGRVATYQVLLRSFKCGPYVELSTGENVLTLDSREAACCSVIFRLSGLSVVRAMLWTVLRERS